jgi:hypothetical protein
VIVVVVGEGKCVDVVKVWKMMKKLTRETPVSAAGLKNGFVDFAQARTMTLLLSFALTV